MSMKQKVMPTSQPASRRQPEARRYSCDYTECKNRYVLPAVQVSQTLALVELNVWRAKEEDPDGNFPAGEELDERNAQSEGRSIR